MNLLIFLNFFIYLNKALVLLEFLAKAGSECAVSDITQRLSDIDILTKYCYVDDDGHDQGLNGKLIFIFSSFSFFHFFLSLLK